MMTFSRWQKQEGQWPRCVSSSIVLVRALMATSREQLLYSVTSTTCLINPEYSNPATFDQVMDIFITQSMSSSL